ncbi:homoserine O-acetyltransferase [Brachybacterium paraconglomeratum]|uniref:homoserine O-acetyltransferase MetX n=1 Tax=Brachybacterium paraconglomeratum TaxID=173362 RepID=UPI0031EA9205
MTVLGEHRHVDAGIPSHDTAPLAPSAATASTPSGAWRPESGAGDRQFAEIGPLLLESGEVLDAVTIAFETWGELNQDRSNAVLVLHALTGDSHVRGPAGGGHPSPGWWEEMVGPGRPIDTDRFHVIAPNVLGGCQGTTGPSSPGGDGRPYGSRFPAITTRDQVAAERRLRDLLGIERWVLVIGGSMGGMRAIEWGVAHPEEVERLCIIASSARATADQIAWNDAQIASIQLDPEYQGGDYYDDGSGQGPKSGLGIARRIAHTTYRTAAELESRFGNQAQGRENPFDGQGRHQVTSYLDHHADKLTRRFDANSYITLARTMSTHDVGRGRGGVVQALGRVSARTLVVAIDSDRLFPPSLVEEIAEHVPWAQWQVAASPVGHDAFLLTHPGLEEWIGTLIGD